MPVSQGTQRKTDEVMDRKALWKLQSTVLMKHGSVMLVLLAKGWLVNFHKYFTLGDDEYFIRKTYN